MGEIRMKKFACKAVALGILVAGSTGAMAAESTALSEMGLSFSGSAALTSCLLYTSPSPRDVR